MRLQTIALGVDRTKGAEVPGVGYGFRVVEVRDPMGVRVFCSLATGQDSERWLLRPGDVIRSRISSLVLYHAPSSAKGAALVLQVFERCDDADGVGVIDTTRPPDAGFNSLTVWGTIPAAGAGFFNKVILECPFAATTNLSRIVVRRFRVTAAVVAQLNFWWGYTSSGNGTGNPIGVGKSWANGAAAGAGLVTLASDNAPFNTILPVKMGFGWAGSALQVQTIDDLDVTLVPQQQSAGVLNNAFCIVTTPNFESDFMIDWEEYY